VALVSFLTCPATAHYQRHQGEGRYTIKAMMNFLSQVGINAMILGVIAFILSLHLVRRREKDIMDSLGGIRLLLWINLINFLLILTTDGLYAFNKVDLETYSMLRKAGLRPFYDGSFWVFLAYLLMWKPTETFSTFSKFSPVDNAK
jgi:hypothetical protein